MPISDLTGCVWVSTTDSLSETMTANYNNPYLINFTYNNDTYDSMFEDAGYRLAFSKNNVAIFVYDWDEGFWLDTPPITLTFTGGTDATNSDLIEWLQDNGTLTAPIVANTYELTHTLTNVSKGNTKFTITADTGYVLPSTVSVSNGTLVSYDSATGEVVVSGDNAVISAECVASAPSGYQVTFTASGSWHNSAQGGVHIYDGQDSSATELLNQVPANKSAFPMTFTISSGYCLIVLDGYVVSNIASNDYSTFQPPFVVDKDGTINIAVWDFDD